MGSKVRKNLKFNNLTEFVPRNMALKNADEEIDFQTEYVQEMARDCGSDFPWDLDVSDMFKVTNIKPWQVIPFYAAYTLNHTK